jgi:hypothetical protein
MWLFLQSLLSHKYGYTSLPREIDTEEFEVIYKGTENEDDKGLLQKYDDTKFF